MHFTDSFLSLLSYLCSLHCRSPEDRNRLERRQNRIFLCVYIETQSKLTTSLQSAQTRGRHQHPHYGCHKVRSSHPSAWRLFPPWWRVCKVAQYWSFSFTESQIHTFLVWRWKDWTDCFSFKMFFYFYFKISVNILAGIKLCSVLFLFCFYTFFWHLVILTIKHLSLV